VSPAGKKGNREGSLWDKGTTRSTRENEMKYAKGRTFRKGSSRGALFLKKGLGDT